DDYWKVLHWYRAGLTTLADTRPDVDWGASPPGTHNVRPMGVAQYNVNRPGSTWFLPVGDLGREWVNLMLSSYQSSGFYLEDPKTRKPAGCDQWIRPGFLEVAFPMPVFDELVLLLHAGQVGAVVQNMRLACEALGLGAWGMGNYSDDLLLGAYPEVCRGLGFRFIERDPDRNPSRTTTCVGLEEHLEATAVPTPWLPDARTAVNRVLESRYGAGGTLSREHNWALESGGPFKPEVVEKIVEHPRAHVPDWVVEAAVETIDYVASEYGCAPASRGRGLLRALSHRRVSHQRSNSRSSGELAFGRRGLRHGVRLARGPVGISARSCRGGVRRRRDRHGVRARTRAARDSPRAGADHGREDRRSLPLAGMDLVAADSRHRSSALVAGRAHRR
ncbi:MAG: hypothetical protein P8Y95_18375, partial [Gammaproteobacteria bacterium]